MSHWIRQSHRWVSIAFTVGVVVNIVAIGTVDPARPEPPPVWVGLTALLPLAFLQFSGLYLLALPHVTRWRGAS